MAWEWSHTPEAYANARANLERLPIETLREIYSEIEYDRAERAIIDAESIVETEDRRLSDLVTCLDSFDPPDEDLLAIKAQIDVLIAARQTRAALADPSFEISPDIPADLLVDAIWSFMEHHRTCTTGGWEAYACPDGCHLVSFDASWSYGAEDDTE